MIHEVHWVQSATDELMGIVLNESQGDSGGQPANGCAGRGTSLVPRSFAPATQPTSPDFPLSDARTRRFLRVPRVDWRRFLVPPPPSVDLVKRLDINMIDAMMAA